MTKPLEGLLVLDLSRYLLGGFPTQYLADYGARVVKIEDTKTGDFTRGEHPMMNGESHYHYAMDRNKESASLNLKDPDVKQAFYEMVRKADILVENYRPGVAARLGIDYETLAEINPKLIYLSFSAYGQKDERSLKPLHDIYMVAETGYYDLNGGNVPTLPQCDFAAAMSGLQGVLTALYTREKTGKGVHIDISMMDSIIWWHSILNSRWFFNDKNLDRDSIEYPCVGYNIYRTKDDRALAFGLYEANFWNAFCEDAGVPQFKDRLKATRAQDPEAYDGMVELIATKTYDEWVEWLDGREHCIAPCITKTEAIAKAREEEPHMIDYVNFPHFGECIQVNTPGNFGDFSPNLADATEPPLLGEHTAAVLKEAGLDDATIAKLKESGAIKVAE